MHFCAVDIKHIPGPRRNNNHTYIWVAIIVTSTMAIPEGTPVLKLLSLATEAARNSLKGSLHTSAASSRGRGEGEGNFKKKLREE